MAKTLRKMTPAFAASMKKLEQLIEEEGEVTQNVKTFFRDEMLRLGHEERVRNLYRVKNKLTSKAEFFSPNEPQEKFLASRKGRDIVLKIRQVGFTTLSGVRGLDYALWEANQSCLILAHLQLTVTTIFNDIVKFTYNHFGRDWGSLYAPTEKSASRTELAFSDDGLGRPLESAMRVLFDGRGKTTNFLHVSEASRVEDERLLGTLQGVPANGEVIYESTPLGRAGDFYSQWQNFKKLGANAPYKGHFIPWYEFYPEEPENWKLDKEAEPLSHYEQGLLEQGLTEAHIAWRRWCIAANCQGDPEKFENEYPSNDVDCFLTGESLVFPMSITKAQLKHVRPPTFQGFLLSEGPVIKFHEDSKGYVAIWDIPKPTSQYVIGCDPSAGVGRDRGGAYVLDRHTKRIVARLWGQFDPADMAAELIKLATYYNKAYICVESNNHGGVVIHVLKSRNYRFLYKRQVIDELTNKPTQKIGFVTTNDSKLALTEKFKTACKEGRIIIQDDDLIDEMGSYLQISSKTGRSVRREAAPGRHDDLVMAACLAVEMDTARGVLSEDDSAHYIEEFQYDPVSGFPIY